MFTLKKKFFYLQFAKKRCWKKFEKIRMNSNEFEKIRKTSSLTIRNSIRFEGQIIRFVRFEKFSIRLIRKYFFDSKNSRKIDSKFARFDSTPPLAEMELFNFLDENIQNQRFWRMIHTFGDVFSPSRAHSMSYCLGS